jgi:hypothetical protein
VRGKERAGGDIMSVMRKDSVGVSVREVSFRRCQAIERREREVLG